jgi:hypothetical protein
MWLWLSQSVCKPDDMANGTYILVVLSCFGFGILVGWFMHRDLRCPQQPETQSDS